MPYSLSELTPIIQRRAGCCQGPDLGGAGASALPLPAQKPLDFCPDQAPLEIYYDEDVAQAEQLRDEDLRLFKAREKDLQVA